MATHQTKITPNIGAFNIAPYRPVPALPNIVAEWTDIIPLVCHLAKYKSDYQLVGHTIMTGRLSVGIFPRLGVLAY